MSNAAPPAPYTSHHVISTVVSRAPPAGWTAFEPDAVRLFSLVFVVNRPKNKLLLGLKKRGFGAGLLNGFGGKPDRGESMVECARRELHEESGIDCQLTDLHEAGELYVTNEHEPDAHGLLSTIKIILYTCSSWTGEPVESEEMQPAWFDMDQLPFDVMWPEDRYYLPALINMSALQQSSQRLIGRVEYRLAKTDPAGERVISSGQAEFMVGLWFAMAG